MGLSLKLAFAYGFSALIAAAFLATSGAHAATLNVVGGELMGASGVDVGGNLFDVQFLNGTCIDLFSGCDSAADFPFTSSAEATQASQALLDQVFVDGAAGLFDTSPVLTNGCTDLAECGAITLYGAPVASEVQASVALNRSSNRPDILFSAAAPVAFDSATSSSRMYAVWTPVPEPGTALLMGFGLAALARSRRKI